MDIIPENVGDVTDVIAPFGYYHAIVVFLSFMRAFPIAFILLSTPFLAPPVDHWCAPPDHLQPYLKNVDKHHWRELAIPRKSDTVFEQCRMYDVFVDPYSGNLRANLSYSTCSRWQYNTSMYSQTTVNEWDLVCNNDYLRVATQSFVMAGSLIGGLILGSCSDRFGRKPTLFVSLLFVFAFGCGAAFVKRYAEFTLLRFLQSLSSAGIQAACVALVMETLPAKHRSLLNVGFGIGFTIPLLLLPALAWWLNNWRHLQFVCGFSTILVFPFVFFTHESPKWLLTKRKYREAQNIVEKIIKRNGKEQKHIDAIMARLVTEQEIKKQTNKSLNLVRYFQTPNLRRNFLTLIVLWMATMYMFYKLALEASTIPGNPFINFAISSGIDIVAALSSLYVGRYCRRRQSQAVGFALSAFVGGVVPALLPPGSPPWTFVTANVIGRYFEGLADMIKWIHVSEVLPTESRSFGFSCCLFFGRIGALVAPFSFSLGKLIHPAIPHVLFAIVGLISTLLVTLLPETLNLPLPDTFEEVEML